MGVDSIFENSHLKKIDKRLRQYDGMLVETGERYDGVSLVERFLDTAKEFLNDGGNIDTLLLLVDNTIDYYKDETEWSELF